jgi:hypothetical protein
MDTPQPYRHSVRYIAGLDVGQMADPSAFTVLERDITLVHGRAESRFDARWLERFPLQTPYPVMARLVRERLERLHAPSLLVIDVTGVGRGIVDVFREEWMTVDPITQERQVRPGKPGIVAVTLLTSAMHQPTATTWDEFHVPKRAVVLALMLALQQRHFRASTQLKEATVLFREGHKFSWKVSDAGNDQYGAWREGQHDDLLLAVAIAVWWGKTHPLSLGSLQGIQRYATPAASPFAPRGDPRRGAFATGGLRR